MWKSNLLKRWAARYWAVAMIAIMLALFGFVVVTNANPPAAPPDPHQPPVGNFDSATFLKMRDAYIAQLRGFPDAKPDSRPKAIRQLQAQVLAHVGHAPNVAWTAIGPAPIPNGQTQTRVDSVTGRLTAIAIDPTNSNIVYVGAAQGGVWRTTDGGATWTPIFDSAQSLAIGALALAPSNHTILYVGTGEANNSCDSYAGVGLYRIDNANTSATLVGPINPIRTYTDTGSVTQNVPVFNGRTISKILVHPTDPATVFVSTNSGVIGLSCSYAMGNLIPPLGIRGLYRSTNATAAAGTVVFDKIKVAGVSCFDLPCTGDRSIDDIVFDPSDPNAMIAWVNGVAASGDGGVWRSANALATPATAVTFSQTFVTTYTGARGILAIYKPAGSAVVYVATGEDSTGTTCNSAVIYGALRRSTDAGATWSAKLAGGGGFCDGQCWYDMGLAVVSGTVPANDTIHLGGNVQSASCQRMHGLSTDGGATFANNDTGLHADVHAIAVDPSNANTVYHLNDGGIWKSTDGGSTWTSLNSNGFNVTQFQSIALHRSDRYFTIGGTQDNGTNFLQTTNVWTRADYGDGGYALIDQSTSNTTNITMYHTYSNSAGTSMGLARVTTTANASDGLWAFLGCGGTANGISCADSAILFYAPMALGPGSPNTVYFGTDRLYRSTNQGTTMTAVSQAPFVSGQAVSAIGISRWDDNVRIVGLQNGNVYYTILGSSTLTALSGIPAKYITRAVIEPTSAGKYTAYITLGGYFGGTSTAQSHVWKVTNLDTTPVVTGINNGLPDVPVNAFVVDGGTPSRLFAGTDVGVYASTDSGATWAPYGTGLPIVAVFDMAISEPYRLLKIATHGRGMWEINIGGPTAVALNTFSAAADDSAFHALIIGGMGVIVLGASVLTSTWRRKNRRVQN